ncbi:hypothetical protein PtrSN002B_000047 [Pyrenophora tritici-repentis]|uniref:Uncharacterized protein n=2 Tax=Pyrenophora tritici-repentis TaxID=45151 RepID=A0A2W1F8T7_9PLEO|nr:uncharacterized protein PTRG_07367 [Pyrenophora tritici-repentis Pt-1C-BFP]KAI1511330.1 hypothetical protein Ptr86124_009734 [Pyrenophora tritici-repentis]EDU50286.1 predicted protein [Pyrenophora tritici-repentis Pt-1C-BFP]KAI1558867.1 hypothetical protein PtrSN002B_000047 [Pyrenophora tritici-repentis]KAI1589302.1 hypothetical protein PtrEW7m1_000045 [Pyrenophora tritici-repentis]KAI1667441.1 hypothetical protein L13192_08150 [Pyrenophora tritici-repentis]
MVALVSKHTLAHPEEQVVRANIISANEMDWRTRRLLTHPSAPARTSYNYSLKIFEF